MMSQHRKSHLFPWASREKSFQFLCAIPATSLATH